MDEETNKPVEHKTYEKKKLFTIVYQVNNNDEPISYHRVYDKTMQQIRLIEKEVKDYYGYNGEGFYGKHKLNMSTLAENTGIAVNVLRELLIRMASLKRIIYRDSNGRNYIFKKEPYLLLQQKSKAVDKKGWGLKTPLYILPFEKAYIKGKEEPKDQSLSNQYDYEDD